MCEPFTRLGTEYQSETECHLAAYQAPHEPVQETSLYGCTTNHIT